jgi:hypothetical protein
MIDVVVRSFIGNWGGILLDFYSEHSLWINGLLLIGALVLGYWRKNQQDAE